jgi:chromosome segregation ATPase
LKGLKLDEDMKALIAALTANVTALTEQNKLLSGQLVQEKSRSDELETEVGSTQERLERLSKPRPRKSVAEEGPMLSEGFLLDNLTAEELLPVLYERGALGL